MSGYMLVRMDNDATDMTVDVKIMEGSKDILEAVKIKLNNSECTGDYHYGILEVGRELYDGKLFNYGIGDTPEEVFNRNKTPLNINGVQCKHNLSNEELKTLNL